MSSQEVGINVYVHFYGEPPSSRLAEGDILTEHRYPSPSSNPEQLELLSPSPLGSEKPVAITPQTTHDQRVEIADYSERNRYLTIVDKRLSYANGRESAAERVKHGFLKGYNENALRRNAKEAREEARQALLKACGHCVLDCAIRAKFTKWNRIHESADTAKTADQEPREAWRRRLVKDPEAHCLPGKTKKKTAA
jgi:hypothetical protein